jgi:hypothetical protein
MFAKKEKMPLLCRPSGKVTKALSYTKYNFKFPDPSCLGAFVAKKKICRKGSYHAKQSVIQNFVPRGFRSFGIGLVILHEVSYSFFCKNRRLQNI